MCYNRHLDNLSQAGQAVSETTKYSGNSDIPVENLDYFSVAWLLFMHSGDVCSKPCKAGILISILIKVACSWRQHNGNPSVSNLPFLFQITNRI